MKFRVFLLFVLASVAVCVTRKRPRNRFEAGVLKLIKRCQIGDVNSLPPAVALPALNPLRIPPLIISRYGEYSLTLGEITVFGFKSMRVKRLTANPSNYSMSIEVVVPKLLSHSDQYRLETQVGPWNFVFTEDQQYITHFTCYVTNLNVRADVRFVRSGSNTVISSLKVHYTVGDMKVHFGGSPSYVDEVSNSKIREMLNESRMVENFIKQQANQFLQGLTPQQFIQIISNI